jgi:hypothetical protein
METVLRGEDGIYRWHWQNVIADLNQQAGYHGVISLLAFKSSNDYCYLSMHKYMGTLKNGEAFFIKWDRTFMFLKTARVIIELVDAFSIVLGCKPFCRYEENNGFFVVIGWNKVDPEAHYLRLKNVGLENLTRYVNV